jgi:hypothetical protein
MRTELAGKVPELFHMLNPINHSRTASQVEQYMTEPYAVAGDVYDQPAHRGRGGWTWFTGSVGQARGVDRSLPVDFDILFAAAIGDSDHDANTDHDHNSDHGPCRADGGENAQFPERGEKATNEDGKAKKIHTRPFHDTLFAPLFAWLAT